MLWRIWKKSTESEPCAIACHDQSRMMPGRFTGLKSRVAVIVGVCSMSQNGWPSFRPRMSEWLSAMRDTGDPSVG